MSGVRQPMRLLDRSLKKEQRAIKMDSYLNTRILCQTEAFPLLLSYVLLSPFPDSLVISTNQPVGNLTVLIYSSDLILLC